MRWQAEEQDRSISIDYLTWPEIAERMHQGFDTIVFSVGATEQHGPHLPENIDELIGTFEAMLSSLANEVETVSGSLRTARGQGVKP